MIVSEKYELERQQKRRRPTGLSYYWRPPEPKGQKNARTKREAANVSGARVLAFATKTIWSRCRSSFESALSDVVEKEGRFECAQTSREIMHQNARMHFFLSPGSSVDKGTRGGSRLIYFLYQNSIQVVKRAFRDEIKIFLRLAFFKMSREW